MAGFELNVAQRMDLGKGSTRRLRRLEGRVPAVVYGGSGKDPESVALSANELRKALENEAFYSHVLTLKHESGNAETVILKDLQRHPARGDVMHADFLRVDPETPVLVGVPLHFINRESCIGVRQEGGSITIKVKRVTVRCLPERLPEYIEVDMADVHVKQSVRLSGLALPDGIEIPQLRRGRAYDTQVAAVNAARGGSK